MENKTIRWCGYEWNTQERWGQVHPDKNNMWYDPSAIEVMENGDMVLKTQYNPKDFDGFTSNIGVGLLSCTEKFGYGTYSLEAKLPKGSYLWPAFWMYSWEEWPPEIDIFEAYSNKKGSYCNYNIDAILGNFWDVKTNIHLGEVPNNYNIGAKTGNLGMKNPSDVFNTYSLEWSEKFVKFYYNNKLVRTVKDENTLSQLRGKTMNVIINNAIQDKYDVNSKNVSEFVVRNFKYEKNEN
jgi:beta-glucanase (GH16 family)